MAQTTAASFSQRWWCLVIGVDDAKDPALSTLGSAERDAGELAVALSDPEGCAIPADQILNLVGADATRKSFLSGLDVLIRRMDPEDSLLIYFAGHGLTIKDQFLLCTSGVDLSFSRNGVTGADLDLLLGPLAVRGVLVILDCCESAGLAEHAPDTFRSLRQGEYRILLSSARAGQSSWELSPGKGTLFSRALIDIIAGRISTGGPEGAIYFAELIRALDDNVAELRETDAPSAPAQQLIYTGAFSKDPLLFVHRGLSLRRLHLQTARYSPAYVRRLLSRAAVSALAILFFLLTSYYAWLENTEYAVSSGKNIDIFRGYPDFNAFGFPKHIWTLDYKPEWLKPTENDQVPLPLVSDLGKSVLPVLEAQIRPEFRAGQLVAANKLTEARELVLAVLNDPSSSVEARLFSHILLADVATPDDIGRLYAMLKMVKQEPKLAAASALSRLKPEAIFPALMARLPAANGWDHGDILEGLKPPCTPAMKRYLNALMGIESSSPDAATILSTALRVECQISVPALVKGSLRPNDSDDIAGYARFTKAEDELATALKAVIRAPASSEIADWSRGKAVDVFAKLSVSSCFEELFDVLGVRPRFARVHAAIAIGKLCSSHRLQLSINVQSETVAISLFHGSKQSWSFEFEVNDTGNLALLFAVVDEAALDGNLVHTDFLKDLANIVLDDEIRKRSLRALGFRERMAPLDVRHLDDNILDMRRITFESLRLTNHKDVAVSLFKRIGRQDGFYVELFGRVPWSEGLFEKLLNMLDGTEDEKRDAACALAMQAPVKIVAKTVAHKDVLIRQNAASCLPYHNSAAAILAQVDDSTFKPYPIGTLSDARRAIAIKATVTSQIAKLSSIKDRLWRISIMGDHPSTLPTQGLRYWAREQRFLIQGELNSFSARAD